MTYYKATSDAWSAVDSGEVLASGELLFKGQLYWPQGRGEWTDGDVLLRVATWGDVLLCVATWGEVAASEAFQARIRDEGEKQLRAAIATLEGVDWQALAKGDGPLVRHMAAMLEGKA